MAAVLTLPPGFPPDYYRPPRLVRGLPRVAFLTPMQVNVLDSICEGKSNRMIAKDWGVSEDTIKTHVKGILGRMRARDRLHAACLVYSGEVVVYDGHRIISVGED